MKKALAFVLILSFLASFFVSCTPANTDSGGNGGNGGTPPAPPHDCESACAACGGCTDTACAEWDCRGKCICALDIADNPYFPTLSAKMPAIHINTPDGSNEWATKYNRDSKLQGLIDYVDATVSVDAFEDGLSFAEAEAEVKVRGNYTLVYEKKPIRIKFKDKTGLLGLHDGEKYKNWVLLADFKDLSMLNNTVAFYFGQAMLAADGYYCTDFCAVEVYLNGEYWGVYLLAEQQEAKGDRTSAPEVPKNYTGNDVGYFFEYDGYHDLEAALPDGDPTFTLDYRDIPAFNLGYTVKSDINAESQLTFLKNHMQSVFSIAYEAIKNGVYYKLSEGGEIVPAPEYTSAEEAVGAVLDLDSLVSIYILNELACDIDVDFSSFYLSLDMTEEGSGKVVFEAPWDFDSSFGMIKGELFENAEALYAATEANPWLLLVVGEEWFQEAVREKWNALAANGVFDGALSLVRLQKEIYKGYYISNYERWSARVLYGNGEVNDTLNSYHDIATAQGLAADYLYTWLSRRIAFLDSLWGAEK